MNTVMFFLIVAFHERRWLVLVVAAICAFLCFASSVWTIASLGMMFIAGYALGMGDAARAESARWNGKTLPQQLD